MKRVYSSSHHTRRCTMRHIVPQPWEMAGSMRLIVSQPWESGRQYAPHPSQPWENGRQYAPHGPHSMGEWPAVCASLP